MRNSLTSAPRGLRSAATAGVLVLAIGTLAACSSSEAAEPDESASATSAAPELSGQVVFADYGGSTNEARQMAYFDGFEAETGVEVVSATLEESIMYSMLEGEEGDYDLFQVSPSEVATYASGMTELPESVIVNDTADAESQKYATGTFWYGIAQAWLTETYGEDGPQNWAEFFDTEKFPGMRAWPGAGWMVDASYEIALLADGVAEEDLYPLDIPRAQAKLDTIRDSLVFYTGYSEVQTLLTSGTVDLAVTVTGQYVSLMNQGVDVTVQWNEAFASPSFFVVPTAAENKDNAWALANWMAVPENQVEFIKATGYGPSTAEVFDLLDEETLSLLANSPEHLEIGAERDEVY